MRLAGAGAIVLAADENALLEKWIAMGAPDEQQAQVTPLKLDKL